MSRSLDIETVAEGIETAEQADRMRDLGCLFGQGYHFARPMPEAQLLAGFGTASMAPAAVEATTSGRREANGRAANASRRPATPKPADRGQASRFSTGTGAPPRELVVAVLR